MALFGPSKISYLGVDIGTSGIKLIELARQGGRAKLVTYGYSDKPIALIKNEPAVTDINQAAGDLKNILKQSKTTTLSTIASLPGFAVFSSIISLPPMDKKELDQAIKNEAQKVIPRPIEEMVIDYKIFAKGQKEKISKSVSLNQTEDETETIIKAARPEEVTKILLTAAPKELVEKYVAVFKKAGLNLLSLETEPFALTRSLIGADKSTVMIVDLGAVTANISIVSNGIPIMSRAIDTGGLAITDAIQQSLNIKKDQAEQIKKDLSAAPMSAPGEQLPRAIENAVIPLINEVKYIFDIFQGENRPGDGQIEKIVLAGGSAYLPNLPDYISKAMNIKVFIGDPWARVIYPEDLKPVLDEIGPRFATAIGLAMRNIE
ncbi:MAG TPA: type IV pilus assembly protein PilM [Patescibacteria group bacterium]